MAQEIEIKLLAAPADIARLKRSSALRLFAPGKSATERLNSIYYDTPDLGLSRAGLSLRVRKKGRAYIQTLKTQGAGALSAKRGEWECPLPSPDPDVGLIADKTLRGRVESIAGKKPVEPIIETAIRRTKRRLKTRSGDEIELAVDSGEIRTLGNGRVTVPVSEVELELLKGSPAGLFDVARTLAGEAPLTVNLESKAERGLRALEGAAIAAHKAGALVLPPGATAGEACRASLLHCLRHIARNVPAVIEARDAEGVHQIRVGLRRLRVALVAFSALQCEALSNLRERAKELGRALAETRDLDVFSTDLLTQAEEAYPGDRALSRLRTLIERERKTHWRSAVAELRSDRFTSFLIDLAAAAESRAWGAGAGSEAEKPATAPMRRALDQRMAKARKLAKKIESLPADDRHALRIELKKLRYTAELFSSLFPGRAAGPFLKQLSGLQGIFGAVNDAEMARSVLKRLLDDPKNARHRAAAGLAAGFHMGRAGLTWKKAQKRWKKFAAIRPFWRS
ncbi:MAG: CYTH and CHAD domain-containing protein [Alphaproteobacteria bacterium]